MGDLCPRCLEDRAVCLCRTATGCVDLDTTRRMLWIVPRTEPEYCDRTREHRIEKKKARSASCSDQAQEPHPRVKLGRGTLWVLFYPASPFFPNDNTKIPSRLTPVNRDSWTCLPLALVVKSARAGMGSGPGRRLEGSTRSVRGVGVRPAPAKRSHLFAVALCTSHRRPTLYGMGCMSLNEDSALGIGTYSGKPFDTEALEGPCRQGREAGEGKGCRWS